MKILSFDDKNTYRIKRDPNQEYLFDLFQKNVILPKNLPISIFIVPPEFEMRLDRVSEYIYGTPDYMEELMVLNDIINPYSIKEGQHLYYCSAENMQGLYTTDEMSSYNDIQRKSMISSSQQNKNTNLYDQNLPLTIKPSNLQQVKVNKDNLIEIINTFE